MNERTIFRVVLALAVLAALYFAFDGGLADGPDTNLPHALDTTE